MLVIDEDEDADHPEMVEQYFDQILNQDGGGVNDFPIIGHIDFNDVNCVILGQSEKHFPHFNLTGVELETQITENIVEGLVAVTKRVLRDVAPDDLVQIVLHSDALGAGHQDIILSFRRCDQIDIEALLDEIAGQLYSDDEELFFAEPIKITFSIVRPPQGGLGKRKGVEAFSTFSKNRRSIARIVNSDRLCLPRALSVGVAFCQHQADPENVRLKTKYKTLAHTKENNQPQKIEALELCAKAGVKANGNCGSPEALRKFRTYLKEYDILIYQIKDSWPTLVMDSRVRENEGKPRIFLLNENDHFNLILKLAPLFGKRNFCPKCLEGYRSNSVHACAAYCFKCCRSINCNGDLIKCRDCLRDFKGQDCFAYHKAVTAGHLPLCETLYHCKDCALLINVAKRNGQTHMCNEQYCAVCAKFCQAGHLCFIQTIKDPPRPPPRFDGNGKPTQQWVFYDFETVQMKRHDENKNCFVHEPILCVAETFCNSCVGNPDQGCVFCGDRQRHFLGADSAQQFFNYLRTLSAIRSVTVIAHNGSGYDMQILLQIIMASPDSFAPETIINGTRILEMKLYNLRFIDSYNFIPVPLSKFSSTFELGGNYEKAFFPHFLFNVVENNFDINNPRTTNYVSETLLPPKEAYGASRFKANEKESFEKWYDEENQKGAGFNYLDTLQKYCSQDTHILAQGCLKFMNLFEDLCGVNPFKIGVTIASVCSHVLRKTFLTPNTIGIIPSVGCYRLSEPQSREALEWLTWESHTRGVPIESSMNGREPRAGKIKLDGLYGGNNAMQYQGCWFHGCRTCFGDSVNRNSPLCGNASDTLNVRFTNTMKITNKLKQMGYNVHEKWGCEWALEKSVNPLVKDYLKNSNFNLNFNEKLNPRDAFFGGRVSALRTYCNVEGTQDRIYYVDICSLYPYVNKCGKVPIGHPAILLDNIPDIFTFDGLLRCEVLPPTDLFHPVLPFRTSNKKLTFPLCRTCAELRIQGECTHSDEDRMLKGTWVIDELRWAVNRGYVITKKIEAWSYAVTQYNRETDTGGVFKEYVDCFLKSKQEASGWPSQCTSDETRKAYVTAYERAEGIKLDSAKISKNEGLRAISKLLLNSMWGKLGQRSLVTKTEIIKDAKVFFELLVNPEVDVKSVLTINDTTLLVKWMPIKEAEIPLKHTNCVIAAYTTAQARLVLLGYLEQVGENALYNDTDSILYVAPGGEPIIPTGSFLGDMVDELAGYGENCFIKEAVFGGPKNYSFWVQNPTTGETHNVMKVKGFRINASTESIINGTNLKALVGATETGEIIDPLVVPLDKQIRRLPDHTLVSVDLHKTYRAIVDKVRLMPNFRTVPYGFRS